VAATPVPAENGVLVTGAPAGGPAAGAGRAGAVPGNGAASGTDAVPEVNAVSGADAGPAGGDAVPGGGTGRRPGADAGAAAGQPPDEGIAAGPALPSPRPRARAGRNLPAALAVGLLLGALALVTLFTVKVTFLVYMSLAAGVALWELARAMATRGIRLPLPPVAIGGAAAVALAYWRGERALAAALAITVIAILAWRLPGERDGYLRDVAAGVLSLAYIPLMASFVALMLAAPDGGRRTLVFLILAVCSDVGGYFAGILIGRHLMAPAISPKKTWEGFSGSVFACLLGGALALPLLLGGTVWQGILLGAAGLAAATLGDLAESMIKRDLQIKDMGTVLPGHGGILDRIDSLLISAPVVWLLLVIFVPVPH
jgi:phosphatidate cytidylyltransferase